MILTYFVEIFSIKVEKASSEEEEGPAPYELVTVAYEILSQLTRLPNSSHKHPKVKQ